MTKKVVRGLFEMLPFPVSLFVSRSHRSLIHLLPPRHAVRFSRYYGSLSIEANTTYPIERQMLSGIYDPATTRILERFVRPGDVCLDIGANVGALTLVLGTLVGREGRVLAFEPGPELFAKLERNLSMNEAIKSRVRTYQCGLSDEDSTLCWQEDTANLGNAFLFRNKGTTLVPVKRLDGIADVRESPVQFCKIDVEGMELRVLRGARETITRTRCFILFEAMPGARRRKMQEDGEDIFCGLRRFFEETKYHVFEVLRSGELREICDMGFGQNNLAVPSEMEETLRVIRTSAGFPASTTTV